MKKWMSVLLMVCLLCGMISATAETTALVVFFSRAGENYNVGVVEEGNTARLARIIAEQVGADTFEIIPEKAYPVDYEATKVIATRERQNDERPAYLGKLESWERYDTVFIGYPIWWGGIPMILYSFMEDYDWSGKTVIPFNTHEGSGQGGTVTQIEALCPGATMLQGLAVRGSKAQNDLEGATQDVMVWLEELRLK